MTYSEYYRTIKNDPAHHIETQRLRDLLAEGYTIESRALGRYGIVIEVSDTLNWVTIQTGKTKRSCAATWFSSGDPVELMIDRERKYALIKHPAYLIDGLFRGNEEMPELPVSLA